MSAIDKAKALPTFERDRALFEERYFAAYFVAGIRRNPNPPRGTGALDYIPDPEGMDKATLCERDGDHYKLETTEAAWFGWCLARVNPRAEYSARDSCPECFGAAPYHSDNCSRAPHRACTSDTERLDWLERQHVEVRTPARYGSFANFHACPDLEEETSDLRARIDKCLAICRDKEPTP